ncbi:NucA/NucB deoxyribonuclease domain-containing protein [Streptomyces sp. A1547]|uniref:NucA/NucB deoxyribonuclease domain-containing protein n=1 Tax=Streptomyces sp. A1547 TaxID=2563105 RepID=UPI00109E6305|nr:NucA/NucB deoxyribonuclease domain-containing protein [Streptomyces sp. A1547]THA33492.1 hypothetical protein E6W17_31450 [Streptomyces sp. A1547]
MVAFGRVEGEVGADVAFSGHSLPLVLRHVACRAGRARDRPPHRLINRDKQDANRDVAIATCNDVWGNYEGSGLECDEYPFSSTYEGAAKNDNRYSARLIDGRDNRKGGERIQKVYEENRILDNDLFYLKIVP